MNKDRFNPAESPMAEETPLAAPLTLDSAEVQAESANEQHFNTAHLLKDLRGHTISSGFITMISQAAQFVLNLLSTMVLARLLLPADFGVVVMVRTGRGF